MIFKSLKKNQTDITVPSELSNNSIKMTNNHFLLLNEIFHLKGRCSDLTLTLMTGEQDELVIYQKFVCFDIWIFSVMRSMTQPPFTIFTIDMSSYVT